LAHWIVVAPIVLRPDARALVVFAEGGTRTLGVIRLTAGYRF
jgi:hypothetical protein